MHMHIFSKAGLAQHSTLPTEVQCSFYLRVIFYPNRIIIILAYLAKKIRVFLKMEMERTRKGKNVRAKRERGGGENKRRENTFQRHGK